MNLKQKLKLLFKNDSLLLRVCLNIFNSLPFNNKFRLHKNKFIIKMSLLKKCQITVLGKGNTIIIEKGCYLSKCSFFIKGNNNTITLSKSIFANMAQFHIEDDNNSIIVGEHTSFSGDIHIACIECTKIIIGQNCLFSSGITLRTGDSHSILDMDEKRINPSANIVISDHVWVGHKVSITKGVFIAKDCIIGTGAILTKQIQESNTVIAGIPAKVIKHNVKWCAERL